MDGEPDAAALFYAMAISNGLDSRVVTAVADGKPHSFNLVKVYDKWYAVDVTRGAFLQGKDAIAGYTLDAFYTTNAFQKQYPLSDTAFDPANTASGALENGLRWRYDAAKAALIISGQGAMQDFALQSFSGIQTVTRPWTAYVSEGANYILEEGVTDLGSYALYGVVFDSIKLPSTLQTVGEGAFRESRGIAIALPEGLKEIGKEAFMDSHVMQLSVPDSVTAIGDRAFSGCARLDALGIPAGIESVGEALVDDCLSLRKVLFLGDEETWAAVAVGGNNQKLKDLLRNGSGGFFDVPEQEWFYAPVQWAAERNVTGGVGNGRFGAYDGCTRAQVVTFLWAANGKPAPKNTNNPFEDVADDAWYLKPVLWAVETGITTGISDTQFGPDGTCTRAQIVTFLYAAANKPAVSGENPFEDVGESDWYLNPVLWAAEEGVTGGIGEGKFGPNDVCTRAQVVTFLYKVFASK
ncbi:MAG: S-layer homology domain-containing protein [Oscillospiraceae bacterium]|nr:S-layer homology domain-containing protein [Oscillospiraceae bacterium]